MTWRNQIVRAFNRILVNPASFVDNYNPLLAWLLYDLHSFRSLEVNGINNVIFMHFGKLEWD